MGIRSKILPGLLPALIALIVGFADRPTLAQDSMLAYTVQPGESLQDLSLFYSQPLYRLVEENEALDTERFTIGFGEELTIPVAFTPPPPMVSAPEDVEQAAAEALPGTYIVERGDTLFRIAARLNVSPIALAQRNGISNLDSIYAGQTLTIPTGDEPLEPLSEPEYVEPTFSTEGAPAPTLLNGKQIIVWLSAQQTFAYEDGNLLRQFVVSTGLPATPTVTGHFNIYLKWDSQTMSGPGYNLPNVPWVMYFYRGYGLHGTYWHNNFGQPMSHGCVNMRTPEAEWLYNWAPIGTSVYVVP